MGGSGKTGVAAGKDETAIGLPADFRMAELATVHEQFRAAAMAGSIALDASAVERVDTAALQLLLAFHRDTRASGATIAWKGASTALLEAAQQLGLSQTLALPTVMSA